MTYCGKSEEAWQELERDYQRRRASRTQQAQEQQAAQSNPDFVLIDAQGRRTSCFTQEDISRQLKNLTQCGQRVALEPLQPVSVGDTDQLTRLECGVTDGGLTLIAVLCGAGGRCSVCARPTEERAAAGILLDFLNRRAIPDLSGWQPLRPAVLLGVSPLPGG